MSTPLPAYPLQVGQIDEAIAPDGCTRELYGELIPALEEEDLSQLSERIEAQAASLQLTFGPGRAVAVDPVPRLLAAREWRVLEAGLLQRARALNAFVADAYGSQRIFDAGILPRRLLQTAAGYEPLMRGLLDPEIPAAAVAGFDLVRDSSGQLLVLEDNLRMPSGSSYAAALRRIVEPALGFRRAPRPLDSYTDALGAALQGASPRGRARVRRRSSPTDPKAVPGLSTANWGEPSGFRSFHRASYKAPEGDSSPASGAADASLTSSIGDSTRIA